jgi:ABC-2 type transport system ATP-binding protein
MSKIIETLDLCRDFKDLRAVDSLNLSIKAGEIFGLVGPDGAGKTTVLRILAGLVSISSGSAYLGGFDLSRQAEDVKSIIGYMAQQFSLYGELSVAENLKFFSELFDVPKQERGVRLERLMHFARLEEFQDRRAEHLSGGMQKKLALACTLINEPEILLLDEPTTGVDPISRREFWDILTELHLSGTTIVVSTPYMDEAERCSRVGLMYQGRLIICDEPKKIQSMVEGDLITLRPDDWRTAAGLLASMPGVLEVQTYGESLRIFLDDANTRIPEIESTLQAQRMAYSDLRRTSSSMEEAFISLIKRIET